MYDECDSFFVLRFLGSKVKVKVKVKRKMWSRNNNRNLTVMPLPYESLGLVGDKHAVIIDIGAAYTK